MALDLPSAAQRLGVSPDTVRRWARQGVIGLTRPNGELHFEEEELVRWARQQGLKLRAAVKPSGVHPQANRPLTSALHQGGIVRGVVGGTPAEVLASIVQAADLQDDVDREQLLGQLLTREQLSSTGLGHGLAMPHPRTPSRAFGEEAIVILGILSSPVDWNSLDGAPVDLVFLLLNPDPQTHLRVLSRLSYVVREEDLRKRLRSASSDEEVLEAIAENEPEAS